MRIYAGLVLMAFSGCDAGSGDAAAPLVSGETVQVRFARSIDVAWFEAPKLAAAQQADLRLGEDTETGVPGPAFLVVDPDAVVPEGTLDGPCAPGDRIISGEVIATAPLDYERLGTEHDPDWAEAEVLVTAVICDLP
jgi:hypothetical protein